MRARLHTAAVDGVVHGGTGAGPPPRFDFSTNANALGPDPLVVEALADVDPGPYPDPAYTRLRERLAAAHGRHPDDVAVGAGASELIARIVAVTGGPVLTLTPTFGEYRHAAACAGEAVVETPDPEAFLAALPRAAVAFLCEPNSPDGTVHDAAFLHAVEAQAAAGGCVLALDLAYAPLSERPVTAPPTAWTVHSPNKAHGVTGVRAGYILAPGAGAARLRRRAPSWILSSYGEALLGVAASDAGRRWVAGTRPTLWAWRDDLAAELRPRGMAVTVGAANFLLADTSAYGQASTVAAHLSRWGVRVRDATSFGLPDHVRLRAHAPDAVGALLDALDDIIEDGDNRLLDGRSGPVSDDPGGTGRPGSPTSNPTIQDTT